MLRECGDYSDALENEIRVSAELLQDSYMKPNTISCCSYRAKQFELSEVTGMSIKVGDEIMTNQFARISFAFGIWVAAAVGLVPCAAAAPTVSVSKNICLGSPSNYIDPANCPLAFEVPVNAPAFYVIKVTNLPGEGYQTLNLMDSLPGFTMSSAVTCTDQTGASITITPGGSGSLGSIGLAEDTTVTCFVTGSFTSVGPSSNTVTATGEGPPVSSTANATILSSAPLNTNLKITKTVSPPSISVTGGPAVTTYTIRVTNTGTVPADIGAWFKLHDTLALKPNSVPLYARLMTTSGTFGCNSASTNTDCLDLTTGPAPTPPGWRLIGTMAPVAMFDWGFPTSSAGHIEAGEWFEVTFQFEVKKVPGITCTKGAINDGLANQAFFTLTNASSSVTDGNTTDNTANADLSVVTGLTYDPNCTCGGLTFQKTQVMPPASSNPRNWPANIAYEIYIKNTLVPLQTLTINGAQFKDYVIEGVNTPPFKRTFQSASCVSASLVAICNTFNTGGGAGQPPFNYSYYGQSKLAWETNPGNVIVLPPGAWIKVRVTLRYSDPDCDTVPNANPKPIVNRAQLTYNAIPLGGGAPISFTQSAKAVTTMNAPAACKFEVTKTRNGGATAVQFGTPIVYTVVYKNNEPARSIGTVADMVRFSGATYATPLRYSSQWYCTASGVTGAQLTGLIPNGAAVHSPNTAFPTSPAMNLRLNPLNPLFFNAGGTLTCTVKIIVKQPKDNANCTTDPTLWENVAFMDTTHPFNTNATFPPSGAYAGFQSPNPQNKNWASHRSVLPKCYEANLNKEASVPGLPPGSPPWTYPSGPAVNYAVTVGNVADSPLTGSGSFDGLAILDQFSGTYSNTTAAAGTPVCSSPLTCSTSAPFIPKSFVGIAALAAHTSGVWNLVQNGPFTVNTAIDNCARIAPAGAFNSPKWYNNASSTAAMMDCVKVPVVQTANLTISKNIINQVGAPSGSIGNFSASVTCSPLALFGGTANIALPGIIGSTGPGVPISNVPVGNSTTGPVSCAITETAAPPVPATLTCPLAGTPPVWIMSPTVTVPIQAGTNNVTITNILTCSPHQRQQVKINKIFDNQTGATFPSPSFIINVACTPNPANPPSHTLTGTMGGLSYIEAGSSCIVSEPTPAVPAAASALCAANGKVAVWETVYDKLMPLAVMGPGYVNVTNTLKCK